jgi:plasmid stabilization system protein ParE
VLYLLSKKALNDIEYIFTRISQHNLNSAKHIVGEFYRAFDLISKFPFMGSIKENFTTKPYRWIYVEDYWIVYEPVNPIKIIRILSSYNDISNKLYE